MASTSKRPKELRWKDSHHHIYQPARTNYWGVHVPAPHLFQIAVVSSRPQNSYQWRQPQLLAIDLGGKGWVDITISRDGSGGKQASH